jgi:hypothetical protein
MVDTLLYGFLAFLTIVTAYYSFCSKINIFPDKPIDIANPFATHFVLKNDSWLWITNVKPHKLIIRNINNHPMGINVNLVARAIPCLVSGETTSFSLPVSEFIFQGHKINYIKIEIVVFYSSAFVPFFKKEKHVRFDTIQSKDGNLKWVPKAMSE